jgi:predicted kinase
MQRQIVLVSGPPGAGKTTAAVPLAAQLGFPLLSKDTIKEAIWDALDPPPDDLAWSRRVGGAAMHVVWAVAACCPQAVLEANFRPHSEYQRARLTALDAQIVEVYCSCSPAEALRRYAERGPHRHPTHVLRTLSAEYLAQFDQPFGLGPVIAVDTEQPVEIERVVEQVRAYLISATPHQRPHPAP